MPGEMAEEQTTRRDREPGRALDVSAFEVRRRPTAPSEIPALHVCPCCESPLVFPIDWAPAERKRWRVDLRCPDCEWHGSGVYAQDIVDQFDEVLDAGTEHLLADLHALTRANMEDQVARFVSALWADQVLPEDF
jgi:hypothetical protein